MVFNKYPNLKKILEKYDKMDKFFYKMVNQLETAYKKNCLECPVFNNDLTKPFKDRFLNCGNCSKSDEMVKKASNYLKAKSDYDDYINSEFSMAVFNELIKDNPYVFHIRKKCFMKFSEAFGNIFSDVPKEMYISLVGLVTENGGLYRLKEN